ncbi:NADPH-dependent diflavin oxidoreductase 1 [Armadillidium nasatum]|uniref:NADPH-dependent diflavin oxidoreductase 1 n=1 Tax=Armadillidium nasatum TaxID=96803 RepID=A0A5N5T0P6_9CRUS|nr:NADPH-dependent diflavin oxidoreductase 1 [Armadillidium nasatum]
MDDCSLQELTEEKLVVFVAATTGQGDDPANMKTFFQTLWNKRSNRNLLKDMYYGVLGLGDSSYQKFNFAAKRLNKLIQILGAKPIINIGLADDQHELGPDFIIDKWVKELFEILLNLYPLPSGLQPITEYFLPPPKYHIKFVESESLDVQSNVENNPKPSDAFSRTNEIEMKISSITKNLRKTSVDHFQDVRLIEFDVTSLSYSHNPGDILTIQPQNLDEYVEEFIECLGLERHLKFYIFSGTNNFKPSPLLPQPCTVEQCVKCYFDIQCVPKRHFFELLSHFTTDENEKEKFLEFASAEGQEEMFNYCTRPKRSILEALADFPFTKNNIPFEYLFNLIPPIKPRDYSIASSCKTIPGRAQILMAVVNYKTILKRPRLGLCSNWLARLELGSLVYIGIKKGTLLFPDSKSECPPVVMIAPGTGCAPFRSYIQERIAFDNSDNLILIFGCRGKDKDYFFKEEWEYLSEKKKLLLFCAFSRDQEDKIYIQHVMKDNYQELWKYIGNANCKIYYAGNAKRIPIDVYEALQYICEKALNLSTKEAEAYMKKNIDKRYQTESWA